MTFVQKLQNAWEKNNSLLCVGLDPDVSKFPTHLHKLPNSIFEFNKQVIEATADLVCAFKPQIAFYSAVSAEHQLELTIQFLKDKYPHIPVILDAKRGDIGNTAEMYASEAFERYQADAVTVNPYMGFDSLLPFLKRVDKGIVVLCRTSNPGAGDLQDLLVGDKPLYQIVAEKAVKEWNVNNNIVLVVGATYPKELSRIREVVGDNMPLLVPGLGAQGADVEKAVQNGINSRQDGMIINASRAVIYASSELNFAEKVRSVASTYRDEINSWRNV